MIEVSRKDLHTNPYYSFPTSSSFFLYGRATNPSRGKCTLTSTVAGFSSSTGLITISSGDNAIIVPIVGLGRGQYSSQLQCQVVLTHPSRYHPALYLPSRPR